MEWQTIIATIHHRPKGRREDIKLTEILPEDAEYINKNNIKVSLEEDGASGYIMYFDYGRVDEEGEPEEHIELSFNKTCKETIQTAIERIKKFI